MSSAPPPPTLEYQTPGAIRVETAPVIAFCLFAAASALSPLAAWFLATMNRAPGLLFEAAGLVAGFTLLFVGPFWLAVWVMHVGPFDRPTGLSIRRMPVGLQTFFVLACASYLATAGPLAGDAPFAFCLVAWLCVGVFVWLICQLPYRRSRTINTCVCVAIGLATISGLASHRCEHVTIVEYFGVPIYEHGFPCGNPRHFWPIWREPWRFRS